MAPNILPNRVSFPAADHGPAPTVADSMHALVESLAPRGFHAPPEMVVRRALRLFSARPELRRRPRLNPKKHTKRQVTNV